MRTEISINETFRIIDGLSNERKKQHSHFRTFNRVLGTTATALSIAAGGPFGLGLAAVAVTSTLVNERRTSKSIQDVDKKCLEDKISVYNKS